MANKPLCGLSDNLHMAKLARCAVEAGNPARKDVGDSIDRGLILLRLINEAGYDVVPR
jgi:hypothetical protein